MPKGLSGYQKRKSLKPAERVPVVMHEFKAHNLHQGRSEKLVTKRSQAIAIALSEAGISKMKSSKKRKK